MELRDILEAIGLLDDAEIDLADAALQLARVDAPGSGWKAARAHLSELARSAARTAAEMETDDLRARAAALSALLRDRHRYRGDTLSYDDLANANLLRVIERRRGLPVSLGILWLHAARAAGWPALGVDLPGHFVVALAEGERRLVLDVFEGGKPLANPAVLRLLRRRPPGSGGDLEPMTNRAILLRLQNNIRLRRLQAGELAAALACTEDMLRISPHDATLSCNVNDLRARLD